MNNRQQARAPQHRVIVTALLEHAEELLLVQLARGRFAGFWLLPSATVEEGSLEQTLCQMLPARTGYAAHEALLLSVLEEPHVSGYALRFVFRAQVSALGGAPADGDIAAARWFSRAATRAVLEERDVAPALGVMTLLRAWAEGETPAPLESLCDEVDCPCGSGFCYAGCCGWDAR